MKMNLNIEPQGNPFSLEKFDCFKRELIIFFLKNISIVDLNCFSVSFFVIIVSMKNIPFGFCLS